LEINKKRVRKDREAYSAVREGGGNTRELREFFAKKGYAKKRAGKTLCLSTRDWEGLYGGRTVRGDLKPRVRGGYAMKKEKNGGRFWDPRPKRPLKDATLGQWTVVGRKGNRKKAVVRNEEGFEGANGENIDCAKRLSVGSSFVLTSRRESSYCSGQRLR